VNPTIKVYMSVYDDSVELEVEQVVVDENNLIQVYVRNPLE